jgi:hypothetical protein
MDKRNWRLNKKKKRLKSFKLSKISRTGKEEIS